MSKFVCKIIKSIDLTASELYDVGVENLKNIIENRIKIIEAETFCAKCCSMVKSNLQIKSYLALDLEYLHERQNVVLLQRGTYNRITSQTSLQKIPKSINIKNKKFILKGVITLQDDKLKAEDPDTVMHYKYFHCSSKVTGIYTMV